MRFPPELEDEFEPLGVLGEGGMGVVFEAVERSLERRVAVKCMHHPGDTEGQVRFQREASALAAFCHPSIPKVYRFGVTQGGVFMVMERLEGVALDRVESLPLALRALLEVAEALDYVHDLGLCHRDVKPGNLFVTPEGRGVLLDFGLVFDDRRTRLTETGQVMGTLGYVGPELLRGRPASAAADWYGWGASLFSVLAGSEPYSHAALTAHALEGRPLTPPTVPGLAGGSRLGRLMGALLAQDPGSRPSRSEQVRPALEEFLEGLPEGASVASWRSVAGGAASATRVALAPPRRRVPGRAVPLVAVILASGMVLHGLWPSAVRAPDRRSATAPPSPGTGLTEAQRGYLDEFSTALEALLTPHLEACASPPCPATPSTVDHLAEHTPTLASTDEMAPLLVKLHRLDAWSLTLSPTERADPRVRAAFHRLLLHGIRHLHEDFTRLASGKGTLESGVSSGRIRALSHAFEVCHRTQIDFRAWIRGLLTRDPAPEPWLLLLVGQVDEPLDEEILVRISRHALGRLASPGTSPADLGDLALAVLAAHPGPDSTSAPVGFSEAEGGAVVAALPRRAGVSDSVALLSQHLIRVVTRGTKQEPRVALAMVRDYLRGVPDPTLDLAAALSLDRALGLVRAGALSPEAYRAFADLSWWNQRRRALPAPRAPSGRAPEALEALAEAALGAEGLESDPARLWEHHQGLRAAVAELAATRTRDPEGWKRSTGALRDLQWRLFSPLNPPSVPHLIVELALLMPEVFPAASRLELDVHEALASESRPSMRALLVETAGLARTSVWAGWVPEETRRPEDGEPEEVCELHLGTLRAHEEMRSLVLGEDYFPDPGPVAVRTLSTIECLSRCPPATRCFHDQALARRWSLDIPLLARGASGGPVRERCREALARLASARLTLDQERLVAPLVEGCGEITR